MAKFAIEPTDIIKKRSAVIPSLRKEDLRNHCIGGDNWALVGDAAGLAEPLTGEGIYYALYSGWLVGHCLEKDMNYNEEWRHYFTQIVEETSISRIAYKWVNTGIAKAVLKRSRLMRSLMGDQLAAQRSGRYYRVKLFIFLPLILVQTLFSRAQKVH